MTKHITQRQLPDVTADTLFFIVVIQCADGKIKIVTSEEKARDKIKSNPAYFTSWAYHAVE